MHSVSLAAGGLQWRVRTWGRPELPAIVFLHGFTWDGAAWEPIAEALGSHFYCVAPDLPGHGATSRPDPVAEWSFERVVDSLASALLQLGLVTPRLVGYSMGGRLALRLALERALPFEGLVLVGASPGISDVTERRQRAQADAELAERLVKEGTAAFLERWMALPLFDSLRKLEPAVLDRLNARRAMQDPRGLAASLLTVGTGSQPPLSEALSGLDLPTLLVVGEHDSKFRAIAEAMRAQLPQGSVAVVPACGHSVPFERPAELAALVSAYFTAAPLASATF